MALVITGNIQNGTYCLESAQLATIPPGAEALVEGVTQCPAPVDINSKRDPRRALALEIARKISQTAIVKTDAKTPFKEPTGHLGLLRRELVAVSETLHLPSTQCRMVMDGAPLKGQWSGYRLVAFQETADGVALCMDSEYCVWNRDDFDTLVLAETFLIDALRIPEGTVVLVATADASCGDGGTGGEAIREALEALGAKEFLEHFQTGQQLRMAYCGLLRRGRPDWAGRIEKINFRHYLESGTATPSHTELTVTPAMIRVPCGAAAGSVEEEGSDAGSDAASDPAPSPGSIS